MLFCSEQLLLTLWFVNFNLKQMVQERSASKSSKLDGDFEDKVLVSENENSNAVCK